jgi:hypothetical protein
LGILNTVSGIWPTDSKLPIYQKITDRQRK